MTRAFLDAEFTDLLHPELLSLALVTLEGREHYVELDFTTEAGLARLKRTRHEVRDGVVTLWGRVPGAGATEWEMGRRTGEWLLQLAEESDEEIEVLFDYNADFELLEYAIRDANLWDRVAMVVKATNCLHDTRNHLADEAAETCYAELEPRGLRRHHALADALALRAAYVAARLDPERLIRFSVTPEFERLAIACASGGAGMSTDQRLWLRQWLMERADVLDGRRPLDVVGEPGGLDRVERALFLAGDPSR